MARCRGCGASLEHLSPRAVWCGDACRKRTSRAAVRAGYGARLVELDGRGRVASATRRSLEAEDRFDTWLGQAAWLLACHIDVSTGYTLASLVREFRKTLAAAMKGNPDRQRAPLYAVPAKAKIRADGDAVADADRGAEPGADDRAADRPSTGAARTQVYPWPQSRGAR